MNNKNSAFLCFILLIYFVNEDAFADKEDKSDELEDSEFKAQLEGNFSSETSGPPDSHEAMNNRDLSSMLSKSNREKRSYEFLMGLVNNNSRFEVTNVDLPSPELRKQKEQLTTNEALLELMVKIAADPEQWDKVHKLLRKIDNDLTISKKLFDSVQNSVEDVNDSSLGAQKEFYLEKKEGATSHFSDSIENGVTLSGIEQQAVARFNTTTTDATNSQRIPKRNASDEINKMIVILNGKNQKSSNNQTEAALKSNEWPNFESEGKIVYKTDNDMDRQNLEASRYLWQTEGKSSSKTYPRNFAYHRVTGHPLYHTNFDKNPKAYIAVSVIAPKPLNSKPQEEDLILENELRQLKPWTHKQNLKNIAAARTKWIIENENSKKGYNAP